MAARTAFAALLAAVSTASFATPAPAQSARAVSADDPIVERVRGELRGFTKWLSRHRAKGYIGEVGWPGNEALDGDSRWNEVAAAWYRDARRAKLWVTAWGASDLWRGYRLGLYEAAGGALASATPQAAVVERAGGPPDLRGVNLAGAEFGYTPNVEATSHFSNRSPGTPGTDFAYPSAASMRWIAGRGIRLVRMPLRWERIQPVPGAELDAAELARLRSALAAARDAGLRVIVDIHNYGAFYFDRDGRGVRAAIGSRSLPSSRFVDLWKRLAGALKGERAVRGFGLMNEPVGMSGARAWERASARAARAIRAAGARQTILVAGYDWGGVTSFGSHHRRGPWVRERNVRYEAHHYFDSDRSSNYRLGFEAERARAARR